MPKARGSTYFWFKIGYFWFKISCAENCASILSRSVKRCSLFSIAKAKDTVFSDVYITPADYLRDCV